MSAHHGKSAFLATGLAAGAIAVIGWWPATQTSDGLPTATIRIPATVPPRAPLPQLSETEVRPEAATAAQALAASPTSVSGSEESSEGGAAGAGMLSSDAAGFGPTTAPPEYGYEQSPELEPGSSPTTVTSDGASAELSPSVPSGSHPTAVPETEIVEGFPEAPGVAPGTSPTGRTELPPGSEG